MVADKVLAVVILATAVHVHSFYLSNSNETFDEPSRTEPFQIEGVDADAELSTTNNDVHELGMVKKYAVIERLLPVLLPKNDFHSIRDRRSVHRQKRSLAALRRILKSRKGRRRISRKQLPALLALIKAEKKKQRERKRKENNKKKSTNLDSSRKENNQGPSNEINLTVHVDMNEPRNSESSNNEKKDPDNIGRSLEAFQTTTPQNIQNDPVASSNFQIPQNFHDVLGIKPQLSNQFGNKLIQGNFVGQNEISRRRYPAVDGLVSDIYPNHKVINNGRYPVPVFSDPTHNSRPLGKHLWNEIKPSDDKRAFPVDGQATIRKYPIQDDLNNGAARFPLFSNQIYNSVPFDQYSKKERWRWPSTMNDMPLSDNTVSQLSPGLSSADAIPEKIPQSKTETGQLPKSENFPRVSSSSGSYKSKTENVQNGRGSSISSGLKSKTVNIQTERDWGSSESLDSKTENDQTERDFSSSESLDSKTENDQTERSWSSSTRLKSKTENDQIERESSSSNEPSLGSLLTDKELITSNGLKSKPKHFQSKKVPRKSSYLKSKSVNVPSEREFISLKDIKHNAEELIEKSSTVQSPIISVEVTTPKDPDILNKERLASLEIGDFSKKLQNLDIISDREINMLQKMSPRWRKKKNKVSKMFKQLMRRKYFRNNVGKLLGIASTKIGDVDSNTKLILSLMELEEQ